MFIDKYYSEENDHVVFSRQQASDFAKNMADDFNPLHDVTNKRFCVPGDLLFSVMLARSGVSEHMRFKFSGMVSGGVGLDFPVTASDELAIIDDSGKEYLSVVREGEISRDTTLIENLTRSYVGFSGTTFPYILVPLMAEKNVMINPARPLVIYESMMIDLDRLDISSPTLEIDKEHTTLEVDGKRGKFAFAFNFVENGEVVGHGQKRMVASGMREFDEAAMNELVDNYVAYKTAHAAG